MAASMWYTFVRIVAIITCLIGMCLSVYAYYVEIAKENDSTFKAFCDISSQISCSKVFTSKYGKGFGLLEHVVGKDHWINQPNSVFGLAFYTLHIFMGETHKFSTAVIQVIFSGISNIASVYLAYILMYVLNDLCIVCVSTYVVNFILLLCGISKLRYLHKIELLKLKKKSK